MRRSRLQTAYDLLKDEQLNGRLADEEDEDSEDPEVDLVPPEEATLEMTERAAEVRVRAPLYVVFHSFCGMRSNYDVSHSVRRTRPLRSE